MSTNLSNPPSGNERETPGLCDRPRIAVTVGDVAGVGPELALKAVADPEIQKRCEPVLVGPVGVIQRVAEVLGLDCPDQICDVGDLPIENVRPGHFDADTGLASYLAVCRACDMAMSGQVAAMVTGPIQKEAWHLAGVPWPGHTELLASRTNTPVVRMMLTSKELSCVLVTIHVALAEVPTLLTVESVTDSIRLAGQTMSRRLGRPARITVCGLNPHAGEQGLFSHGEESNVIEPAIRTCRDEGFEVLGPLPPDTAFVPDQRASTDVYVCMYHDQGLIPLKALSFDEAVNVTLGLPITRTSVDHGTAMDLAWQGRANAGSFLAAICMAVDLGRTAPVGESNAC